MLSYYQDVSVLGISNQPLCYDSVNYMCRPGVLRRLVLNWWTIGLSKICSNLRHKRLCHGLVANSLAMCATEVCTIGNERCLEHHVNSFHCLQSHVVLELNVLVAAGAHTNDLKVKMRIECCWFRVLHCVVTMPTFCAGESLRQSSTCQIFWFDLVLFFPSVSQQYPPDHCESLPSQCETTVHDEVEFG